MQVTRTCITNRISAFSGYETWLTADQPVLGNDGQQIWRDKDGQIVPAGTADASPEYGFQYMTYETKENASVLVSTGKSERIVFNANTTYNARFGRPLPQGNGRS